jgi:hypothetical protein
VRIQPEQPFRFRSSITESPELLTQGIQVGVLSEAPQGVVSAVDGLVRNEEDTGATPATLTTSDGWQSSNAPVPKTE